MEWYELNENNIEEVKELYKKYIEERIEYTYLANMMTFEEFINKKLKKYEDKIIRIKNEVK